MSERHFHGLKGFALPGTRKMPNYSTVSGHYSFGMDVVLRTSVVGFCLTLVPVKHRNPLWSQTCLLNSVAVFEILRSFQVKKGMIKFKKGRMVKRAKIRIVRRTFIVGDSI